MIWFVLFSYYTLHLFLRIRLDIIPFHNGIEGFNDLCRKKIAVLVDDLNVSYDVILSPDLFTSDGMSYLSLKHERPYIYFRSKWIPRF